MVIQLATATTSFIIAFLIIPVIIKYSLQKNLVDIPGRRKIHKKLTPSMGGIAIFISFFIASMVWIDVLQWKEIKFIIVGLFVIFFIGVRDDLVPIRAYIKLIGQILVALMVITLLDVRLKSLYGLFGVTDLHPVVSYIISVLTVIVITNSFNLIDGLDGLAGTIATTALLCFGIWFYLIDDTIYSIMCFALLGGLIAFLIFNWEPSEIFMGDTGALVVGMMLSILSIKFIDTNFNLPEGHPYKFEGSIGTALCFIIIPLVDTLRIIILRISKKKSPFAPDKSHIHHAIMRLGKTHAQTTFILASCHVLFIGLAIAFRNIGDVYLIPTIIILAIMLSIFLDRLIIKKLDTKNLED